MNSSTYPASTMLTSDASGTLLLNLSTAPFGGTLGTYLDTLHADYAFIISLNPVPRSLEILSDSSSYFKTDWDFILYPNPASKDVFLQFMDDTAKELAIFDLSGRRLRGWSHITDIQFHIETNDLAKGVYYLRVSDGINSMAKKLIIN